MQKLQMVDLTTQHAKIRNEIDEAIAEIIDNSWFIKGKPVAEFENQLSNYLGIEHVIGCANGTDALQAAFMALELPKGSEVIVPDFTFISTAEILGLLDLVPVFVDVEKETFNLDVKKVEQAIGPKTKAIVPVHMFGLPCDMDAIMSLAEKHNLWVVEDTAQAMGAEVKVKGKAKHVGTIGHIGCTSFFPSKNLSCMGDGGAIFTSDPTLAEKIAQLCNHGMDKQYEYERIGFNSRLDGMQAAILKVKLAYLDSYNEARRTAAAAYTDALKDVGEITLPIQPKTAKHIFHQYTLKIEDDSRDALQKHLNEKGIPNKVYYPMPFHEHEAYSVFKYDTDNLQNSKWLCKHVLSLPMHTELDSEQIDFITNSIIEFYS